MAESFDVETLVEEFRDEAREQLDRIDAGLLELERTGALEAGSRNAVLRTLHTLKGNAGMLGLSPIRDYVHVMENTLKADRSDWSDAVVERLFEGVTALRAAVEAARGDREEQTFRALAAARHALEEVHAGPPQDAPRPAPSSEEAGAASSSGDLVRVPFSKLDALLAEVGDLLGEAASLQERAAREERREVRELAEAVSRRVNGLRESVMSLRLVPLSRVLGRFHGLVRRLARAQDKEARLVVEGEGTEMDKSTADALGEPLLHLVRNAIDHGIRRPEEREASGQPAHGTIWIRAVQVGDRVRIEVEDDGEGLDLPAIRERALEQGLLTEDEAPSPDDGSLASLIFRSGFSTRSDVSTVSGQGVGLDVVSQTIRDLRGELAVEPGAAGGTRFVLRLPVTVAVVPSLLVEAGGELLALPTSYVARTLRVDRTERVGATEVIRAEDALYPVADVDRLFGWPPADRGEFGVLVRRDGRGAVVRANRLVDQRDLVVKTVPRYGRRSELVSGGSVLPGGRVVLVLDPGELMRVNEEPRGGGRDHLG